MPISVCMASHNGERFIDDQIDTILAELALEDELIIIDDQSTDRTVELIRRRQDKRIKLQQNPQRLGHVASFAKAIAQAQGGIIVLADQDDVWPENRLTAIKTAFTDATCLVVAGNFYTIDEQGMVVNLPFKRQLYASDSKRYGANLWGILQGTRPYYGCAMAFRAGLKQQILPIPRYVESHDLWIAMAGNLDRAMQHLDTEILAKRQHSKNVSSPKRRHWVKVLLSRLMMLVSLITLSWRKRKLKHACD